MTIRQMSSHSNLVVRMSVQILSDRVLSNVSEVILSRPTNRSKMKVCVSYQRCWLQRGYNEGKLRLLAYSLQTTIDLLNHLRHHRLLKREDVWLGTWEG